MTFIKKYTKTISYIALIVLILSLIPLMILGFFAHPVGDDYYYAKEAVFAYKSTGNFLSIFPAAIKGTIEQYKIWQGTYSAMFLMHLPPHLFGEIFYRIYPSFILLFLTGSIFYMLRPVFASEDKSLKHAWIATSSLIALVCISEVPSCGETFYWYNGSMYYTGFLSLTFVFFGLMFRFLKKKKTLSAVILCFLAFFIAGGNYASLLPAIIVTAAVFLFTIIKKDKKAIVTLSFVMFFLLAGLAISILSPGNSLRGETTVGTTPVKAIVKSIVQSGRFFFYWNGILSFASLMLITPVFILTAAKVQGKIKCPVLLIIFSFLALSSGETASFYAQNNSGPARLFDICFYMMILTLFFIYFMIIYSVYRLINGKRSEKKAKVKAIILVAQAALLVIFLVLIPLRPVTEIETKPNQYTAAVCLLNGEAMYYKNQNDIRMFEIKNFGYNSYVFEPYDVPWRLNYFLHVGDLSDDPQHFNNVAYSYFYGIKSVKIDY